MKLLLYVLLAISWGPHLFFAAARRVSTKNTAPTVNARTLQSTPSRGWGWYPPQTKVPQQFILANTTLASTLEKIALPDESGTSRGTVIFTTLRLSKQENDEEDASSIEMVNSFCYWLHEAGLLAHTMIITTDEEFTWTPIAAAGHPIFLDRVFPRREAYIDKITPADTYNKEPALQKHWWGMRLVELGYKTVFLDVDSMVVLPHLLAPFSEPYDMQGLSDWFSPDAWHVGSTTEYSCGLYFSVKDERVAHGAMLREWWHIGDGKSKETSDARVEVATPCQSTGVWYLQPSNVTLQFMKALVYRISVEAVWQWEQAAWNELIVPFLWGIGDAVPLRYRLLPIELFANVPVVNERKQSGLPTDELVVLHGGGLHGSEKRAAFEHEFQVFRPDFHTPENESNFYVGVNPLGSSSFGSSFGSTSTASGALVISSGVHHWQPVSENTFFMVLIVLLGGMGVGAASAIGWLAYEKRIKRKLSASRHSSSFSINDRRRARMAAALPA